ncbi:MAG: molybdopterin-dependent oxidoreductase [Ktedonobacteraceae bacterium]
MSISPAERVIVPGACPHDCPDTCSMLITVEHGRATEVRGNPDHPFTQGGLCVKVNNYTERVYSPNRVLYPLRRTGPKGSGQFERISWDLALEEISTRFKRIIAEHGPQAILPYSYLGTQGLLNGLNVGDAFFNKMGASVSERTFCDSGACTAYVMTIGPTSGTDPESLVHSKYIILWACNPISTNLHLWPIIAEAQKRGAKVVVIDPFRSRTAQKADWHIPIRPGTDAALALGMMHVIIAEQLTDTDYVEKHTVGYEELKERVSRYTPAYVAEITGIPADDIQRLAREYATSQPAVIRIGVAIERHHGGGQTVRALASLPALVGAWRKPGGGFLQLPLWAFPIKWETMMRPDFIQPGTRVLNQFKLGQALTGEMPLDPPLKALVVYNSNPAVVSAEQDKVLQGLAREDLFTVVSEQFLTDTASFADIVLPATTQLEQSDLMFSWGHHYLTFNQAAIAPAGEAIPNVELFRRLAACMGFTDECFTQSDEQKMQEVMDWSAPALQGIDLDLLKREGFVRLNLPTPDVYAPHAEGNFPTPSGKCEFMASMAAGGNFVLPLFRQGSNEFQPGEPVDPLPNYIPPRESPQTNPDQASRYPLNLLSPKSHAFLNSSYGNLPAQQRVAGEQHLVIHAQDATKRGISDGQLVRIFNDRGSCQAIAQVKDTVMPGVVVMPMGYWRKLSPESSTVNALNSSNFADLGNAPTFSDTLVEVATVG